MYIIIKIIIYIIYVKFEERKEEREYIYIYINIKYLKVFILYLKTPKIYAMHICLKMNLIDTISQAFMLNRA